MMKKLLFLSVSLLGCTASRDTTTTPSTDPPPSWGVPITGGTMLVSKDGTHAYVADPDRDRVAIVDLDAGTTQDIALQKGDEPGRLIEDGAGRVHVALRRGGALVTIANGAITARRAVCAEPRGLAWDSATDLVHVACATGELVSFPAGGGDATRNLFIDRDLRDVIVQGTGLLVSRFRTAELISLDATGAVVSRVVPPTVQRFDQGGAFPDQAPTTNGMVDAIPAVAWRTYALADGRVLVSHQRQVKTMLHVTQGGYGQGCGHGPVEPALTLVAPGQAPVALAPLMQGALPVDIAVDNAHGRIAFAMAGAHTVQVMNSNLVLADHDDDGCGGGDMGGGDGNDVTVDNQLGAPTSIGFRASGQLVIFYPEAPAIVLEDGNKLTKSISLTGEFGYDSGRNLVHQQTAVGIACASCHPEGRDDGLVWTFDQEGTRRTQNLSGHLMQRAPFHWVGDMTDLPTLMEAVFNVRMAGGEPTRSQKLSLGPFLDRLPAPAPIAGLDAAAVDRGKTLFNSQAVGCASCHNGPLMTNLQIVDVGTGGKFKVPSLLGVGARAPYLHTGCATTLADRFGSCGGGDLHGKTSQLTSDQVNDLVQYLSSL
jgi:hypothetical protein